MSTTRRHADAPAATHGALHALTSPPEHGAPPDGGGDRTRSPRELRIEARSVLDRTRRIGVSLRRGSRDAIDEIDALTGSIRTLQVRVDVAAGRAQGPSAAAELTAARHCIQESLAIVLDLLMELEG